MSKINVVCIGDELLDGRTTDRNSVFIAKLAIEYGGEVSTVRWVRDDLEMIVEALEAAAQGADFVVVSGGLGPTSDDLTRDAAAAWAASRLVLDEALLTQLKARFAERGYPFTENNARQCYFPAGARILATEVGTAAGFELEQSGARAMFFPGVPNEFQWFAHTYLVPALPEGSLSLGKRRLKFAFHGIGESHLENKLGEIVALAKEVGGRIGYRASFPIIEVSLSAPDGAGLARLCEHVLARIGPWLVGEGDESLAERIGRRLSEAGQTVTAAESCTAGALSAKITEVSGSSRWFERGYITYANQSKIDEVGVSASALEQHGAVSLATVCQMALGARRRAKAGFALAVSGIAGPSGGSADKPVGTVHFALATDEGVYHRKVVYPQPSREQVRQASVYTALSLLLWKLEGTLAQHRVDGPFDDADVAAGNFPTEALQTP
ncbi:MAG: CinA family nicotinamide mononucleotide deamidase-related protein [Bradymonadaceae bacterium]|nr:CinA family nicotinamide mononucleotide deamidase-related protein [Lujinxingiaceae bacterium]